MTDSGTRRLYHSLVRPTDVGVLNVQQSLRTLELIASIGLLAAPELYLYSVPLPGGLTPEVALFQSRACFTCITEQEVPAHSQHFGPISIELTIDVALALGAAPVCAHGMGSSLAFRQQLLPDYSSSACRIARLDPEDCLRKR